MAAPVAPGRAVYTIYTSPKHAPVPDHLPTLIVTPAGKPQNVLYTYLHTNYNQENYLLTPSPSGDLCIAKMFPSSAITGAARNGQTPGQNKVVRCEGSRALKWSISNTGIAMPTYKLTLPNSDPASGNEDQPLFQVSKTSRTSVWWTLWYFTYAGHLIPPRRVEFGKVEKEAGGTKVTITGKSDEEKAVWKTLGDGNEDMVEWIVLCAALNVLDDEIREAAKSAGQALRAPPQQAVRPGSSNSKSSSDIGHSSSQDQSLNGTASRPARSHSSLDSAERQYIQQQQQQQSAQQNTRPPPQALPRQPEPSRSTSPQILSTSPQPMHQQGQMPGRSLEGAMQGMTLQQSQGRGTREPFPNSSNGDRMRSPPIQQQAALQQQQQQRQRNMSMPADPRQRHEPLNKPLVPLPQSSLPPPVLKPQGRVSPQPQQSMPVPMAGREQQQQQRPMMNMSNGSHPSVGNGSGSSRGPSPMPPPVNNGPMYPLRPGAMQAQTGPLQFRNKQPSPQPQSSLPNGPRGMPLPGTSESYNTSRQMSHDPVNSGRQPISPNMEYFQSRGGMRRPGQQPPPSPSNGTILADNGFVTSPQSITHQRPSFDQARTYQQPRPQIKQQDSDSDSELAYARAPTPSRGPRPIMTNGSNNSAGGRGGVSLTDVNLSNQR